MKAWELVTWRKSGTCYVGLRWTGHATWTLEDPMQNRRFLGPMKRRRASRFSVWESPEVHGCVAAMGEGDMISGTCRGYALPERSRSLEIFPGAHDRILPET